ncbi:penicillin acylase family protein [Granulicella sp. dw_53]|uniref:penicillin acylase family protein n=1 Tax=Granulicella sp. dw_53 TaxID=2719792 RepID=UPI00210510DA|nr:penicillin acylase family protein [Granulicella sp. dw_53]
MTPQDPRPPELDLLHPKPSTAGSDLDDAPRRPSRLPRNIAIALILVVLLLVASFFSARIWARHAMRDSLPQLDGQLSIPGLSAPVSVQRDSHGVPSIHAATLDDLLIAQGFVTAQDRLWQLELLRRHGAGTLAELFGSSALPHDRNQRTLQLTVAAERSTALLSATELHYLELYARGINASIAIQRPHLPLEFRLLHDEPAPWTPRDSVLVAIVMFQDLNTDFPIKLSREVLTTRLPPDLMADLYPVGSWRDHPPSQGLIDLTLPQLTIPNIPLDESQTKLTPPTQEKTNLANCAAVEPTASPSPQASSCSEALSTPPTDIAALLTLNRSLLPQCEGCIAGSNNWVVSGQHTASGKPLLSNDMHLNHGVPNIWYEASLEAATTPSGVPFHAAGVSLPGTPFIVVGHNDHIAWGFTNLGGDVQDVFVERTRTNPHGENGKPQPEFQSADGTWHPILHHPEIIRVRGGKNITLDVLATRHGQMETPVISGLVAARPITGPAVREQRLLSLAWTIYDPANVNPPSLFALNSASDWPSTLAAFSNWGGPAQNMVYADDQGHIGYHTIGKIPLRGSVLLPTALSTIPVAGFDPLRQWTGYIPFEQLPQVFDPPGGLLATANARITPDLYPFPITLNWGAPYRNERIWRVLSAGKNLTPADMLKLQTDVYSDFDHVIAQRLAYAIDHADPHLSPNPKRLHQAADLLRTWNGHVDVDSPAAAIVDTARAALWPILLAPKLGDAAALYTWGEKSFAEEQIIIHTPARWLPHPNDKWDDVLAGAVEKGLALANAPQDLAHWTYGKTHVVDIEHPIFSLSPLIESILGVRTGTGPQPQSGDSSTIKQVGRTFGPSEHLTVDLSNLDNSTLNLVLGQSGNPLSPWFMDQFPAWYHDTTQTLPFTPTAVQATTTHTLTLTP